MPVCLHVEVLLQSGHTRSPIWLDWNELEHIRHFLTLGCRFSACGFLFISERDAINFPPGLYNFYHYFPISLSLFSVSQLPTTDYDCKTHNIWIFNLCKQCDGETKCSNYKLNMVKINHAKIAYLLWAFAWPQNHESHGCKIFWQKTGNLYKWRHRSIR